MAEQTGHKPTLTPRRSTEHPPPPPPGKPTHAHTEHEEATVCHVYIPPTGKPEDSGCCARCGMYDWRHTGPARMAITPKQAAAIEQAERHARAQAYAFAWMEQAQEAEEAAVNVVENQRHRQGWPGIATGHRKVAGRAMTFARAWARVATALVPQPEPLELMGLDTRPRQPADFHCAARPAGCTCPEQSATTPVHYDLCPLGPTL